MFKRVLKWNVYYAICVLIFLNIGSQGQETIPGYMLNLLRSPRLIPSVWLSVFLLFLLPCSAQAFFSPGIESFSAQALDEALQSKRAAKDDAIKKLVAEGLVVSGGTAPSGLKAVTLDKWRFGRIRTGYHGLMLTDAVLTVNTWGTVSTWDPETGKLIRILVCAKPDYDFYGSTPNGATVVVGKSKRKDHSCSVDLAVYDAATLKKVADLKDSDEIDISGDNPFNRQRVEYALSADGRYFAMTELHRRHGVWDAKTGKILFGRHRDESMVGAPPDAAFSPDGTYVFISGSQAGELRSLPDGRALWTRKFGEKTLSPAFSADGKLLLLGNTLVRTADGAEVHTFTDDNVTALMTASPGIVFMEMGNKLGVFRTDGEETELVTAITSKVPPEGVRIMSALAPGGKRMANLCLHKGKGRVLGIAFLNVSIPSPEDVRFYKLADKAISVYQAGLHEQGLALMRSLIAKDPVRLWDENYYAKTRRAGMPMALSGEMLLAFKERGNPTPKQRAAVCIHFAVAALYARQPAAAMEALRAWDALVAAHPDIKVTDTMRGGTALNRALCLLLMGRKDEYYNTLLLASSEIKDFKETTLLWMVAFPDLGEPMFREPKKLAAVAGIKVGEVPTGVRPRAKEAFPSFDGKTLYKGAPPKPTMAPDQAPGGGQPAPAPASAPRPEPKKSSVVLD